MACRVSVAETVTGPLYSVEPVVGAALFVQESLVQRLPATPGFTVDAAYRPASRVGGDDGLRHSGSAR